MELFYSVLFQSFVILVTISKESNFDLKSFFVLK